MKDHIYLTVDVKKRQPENDGYVAVITQGHPRLDDHVIVLDVKLVQNIKEAKQWYKKARVEQPWVQRQ